MKKILSLFLLLCSLCLNAQTKFYLNIAKQAPIAPSSYNAGWNVTSGAVNYHMSSTRDLSTIASKTSGQIGGVAVRKALIDCWVSDELASQTITGTFTGQSRMNLNSTTSTTGQGFLYLRILNRDGTVATDVGTCTTTNLTTTLTNRTWISLSVGTLSIKNGQRICIEIGWNESVGTTTTRTGTLSRGSSSGTDLPANNTTTTANSPWVQFSQTLSFYNPSNSALFSLWSSGVSPPVGYNVWNPQDRAVGITLSADNLTASRNGAAGSVRAVFGKTQGKWYWEIKCISGTYDQWMGVGTSSATLFSAPGQNDVNGWGFANDGGDYHHNNSNTFSGGTAWPAVTNDVFGFALDMDAGTLKIYRNGTILVPAGGVSGDPIFTAITGRIYPMFYIQNNTASLTAKFGPSFDQTPPAGYVAFTQ